MIETQKVIRCDGCGIKYDWVFDSGEKVTTIREIVAEAGWARRGRKDLCSECAS